MCYTKRVKKLEGAFPSGVRRNGYDMGKGRKPAKNRN